MQLQDLLWTTGILAITGLTWTAARSWLDTSQRRLRVKLEPVEKAPVELSNPELPGKVRVVARSDDDNRFASAEPWSTATTLPMAAAPEAAMPAPIPMMRAVDDGAMATADEPAAPTGVTQQDLFGADEPVTPPPPRRSNRARALYGAEQTEANVDGPAKAPAPEPAKPRKSHQQPQEVIALHVLPTRAPWQGEDLLRTVLSFGLRFGEMSIFHRHELPTGQGEVLFSMANAVSPGSFNLEILPSEEVHGVSFFLTLPGVNSVSAFELLADTARRVAHDLGGEVVDSSRSVLTQQLVEHYRGKVQDFERRRLMRQRQSTEV